MSAQLDLALAERAQLGKKFGRLLVVSFSDKNRGGSRFLCKCDCGNERIVYEHNLRSGCTKSCGCLAKEQTIKRLTTHGHKANRETPTYRAWTNMVARCGNPSHQSYKYYGARGIAVDPRWLEFANFLSDMGERPHGKTLDRRDNSKGYSPDNCRWATRKEQENNKRTSKFVHYRGESLTVANLSEKTGVPYKKLWKRLKAGWSVEEAARI